MATTTTAPLVVATPTVEELELHVIGDGNLDDTGAAMCSCHNGGDDNPW